MRKPNYELTYELWIMKDLSLSEKWIMENETLVTEFVPMGLTNRLQLQVVFCVLFLLVYVATFLGNLGMITLIWMDSWLHSPMNFFLSHLSFVDIYSSSVIGPKMLTDIFVEKKVISFFDCAAQICFFFFGQCIVTECFLLASMAYDWHMAICKPLL